LRANTAKRAGLVPIYKGSIMNLKLNYLINKEEASFLNIALNKTVVE
jgi:hypothetical protein